MISVDPRTRLVRRQPHRPFRRTRRLLDRWLRVLRGPEPPVQLAELWQGTRRKTYLVPYESRWRDLGPDEEEAFEGTGERLGL